MAKVTEKKSSTDTSARKEQLNNFTSISLLLQLTHIIFKISTRGYDDTEETRKKIKIAGDFDEGILTHI